MVNEVIREVRENPEAREAVRRLILTDELLAMPATQARVAELLARQGERLDRLEETQARMAGLLAGHGERLDRLEEILARQGERLDRMEETQARMAGLLAGQGERLDRMEETQARMAGLLAGHGERLDRMEETQAHIVTLLDRMNARQDRMDARQDRMEDDLAGIKGSVMEARAERRVLALAPGALRIRKSEIVGGSATPHRKSQRFIDEFRKAGATGAQLDRLSNTDLIIRGRKGTDGAAKRVYLAVEVAYRLNGDDIDRVRKSVDILRNLVLKSDEPNAEVVGALYGARIDDADRKGAAGQDLMVFTEDLPK